MRVFADASAMVSFYDPKDSNYTKAQKLASKSLRYPLLISNFVFAEIVTILSQRVDKQSAILAGKYIKENFTIIKISEDIENLAWEIFKKQTSKNVSFVDCTTFALYQDGAFDKAFTFDDDFETNKIPVLE